MGARYSRYFVIKKSDIDSSLVKVREHSYNKITIIEYWIYTKKPSQIIGLDGQAILMGEKDLKCVISCAGKYITSNTDSHLVIEGVKFTNDGYGNQLDEYLRKTGRGKSG